jgi:hypothetical protein
MYVDVWIQDILADMGIKVMGDVIGILKHAKKVSAMTIQSRRRCGQSQTFKINLVLLC